MDKQLLQLRKADIINLRVGGYGKISETITSNPSSISQGIKVEIGGKKMNPKMFFEEKLRKQKEQKGLCPCIIIHGKFWVKK